MPRKRLPLHDSQKDVDGTFKRLQQALRAQQAAVLAPKRPRRKAAAAAEPLAATPPVVHHHIAEHSTLVDSDFDAIAEHRSLQVKAPVNDRSTVCPTPCLCRLHAVVERANCFSLLSFADARLT